MCRSASLRLALAVVTLLVLVAGVIYAVTPPTDYCANAQCRTPREFCGVECP